MLVDTPFKMRYDNAFTTYIGFFAEKGRTTMLISEHIYQYMNEKGITQLEFSKRTGIPQSTVNDWRRKGTNPAADKIKFSKNYEKTT